MRILPLLGKPLKDDDIIDLLEHFEMEVIYDFDRLHEGQPDTYTAASKEAGIELIFDENQALSHSFFYLAPLDGFEAFSEDDFDVPVFACPADVENFARSEGIKLSSGEADFLGVKRIWRRLDHDTHSVHYEFRDDRLALVTVGRLTRGHS